MRVNDFGIGLIDLLEKNGNYDMERIGKALDFATAAHDGQFRKSGEPYITHPIHVAKILASYESDSDAIIAALLHDTVEDTDVTIEDVKREFGENVMQLVDGVTKLNKLSFNSREEQQIENIRKMLLAMAKDIRVIEAATKISA